MKKVFLALGIATIFTGSSFGYMDASTTSSIDTIKKQGYSKSMQQAVDVAKSHHQGENENYVRHFQPKEPKNFIGKAYQKVKVFFDPAQDDGQFGVHEIDFSNNWESDYPKYATPLKAKESIENL